MTERVAKVIFQLVMFAFLSTVTAGASMLVFNDELREYFNVAPGFDFWIALVLVSYMIYSFVEISNQMNRD